MNIAKKSIFKYVVTLLCTLLMFTFAMPLKEMAEINASAATFTTINKYYTSQGGTCVYYNANAKYCTKSVSWLSVTCTNSGKFTITVQPSNVPRTAASKRFGYVDFKSSNGTIIERYYIRQDNPYLRFSQINVDLGAECDAESETFNIYYNCPFEIRQDGEFVFVTNNSNEAVYEYGSYSNYANWKCVTVKVKSPRANLGTTTKKTKLTLYKKNTNEMGQTITVNQSPMFKSSNTYTCTNSKGGSMMLSAPKAGNTMICDLSNFDLPLFTSYTADKAVLRFDSTSTSGTFSGTMCLWTSDEAVDYDTDLAWTEVGTFTISDNGKTLTLKTRNIFYFPVAYTYNLS